jgi:CheY-like chemotaxis protein
VKISPTSPSWLNQSSRRPVEGHTAISGTKASKTPPGAAGRFSFRDGREGSDEREPLLVLPCERAASAGGANSDRPGGGEAARLSTTGAPAGGLLRVSRVRDVHAPGPRRHLHIAAASRLLPTRKVLVVRVLVVDDEGSILLSTAALLEDLGFEVQTCETPPCALNAAAAWHPEFVLQDVRMPGLDIVKHVAALREAAPGCRVVIFSASLDLDEIVTLAKADGFLEKPFRPQNLLRALEAPTPPC